MLYARREDATIQMGRKIGGYAIAASLILAFGAPGAGGSAMPARQSPSAQLADRVTACGVERWRVKIGTDPDARLVDQRHVVQTNIVRLRSMPPLPTLPRANRVRPVETTVWSVDAILI